MSKGKFFCFFIIVLAVIVAGSFEISNIIKKDYELNRKLEDLDKELRVIKKELEKVEQNQTEIDQRFVELEKIQKELDEKIQQYEISVEEQADDISSFVVDLQGLLQNEYSLIKVNDEYEIAEPFSEWGHCFTNSQFSEMFPINIKTNNCEEIVSVIVDLSFKTTSLTRNEVLVTKVSDDNMFHLILKKNEKNTFKLDDGTYICFNLT